MQTSPSPREPESSAQPIAAYILPPPRLIVGRTIDLGFIVNPVLRYWWLVAAVALATAIAAGVIYAGKPKVYESSVLLRPSNDIQNVKSLLGQGMNLNISSIIGGGQDAKLQVTADALAVLRSRRFIAKYFEKSDILRVITPVDDGSWSLKKALFGKPGKSFLDMHRLFLSKHLIINEMRVEGLLELRLRLGDPEQAALYLAELVQQLDNTVRDDYLDASKSRLVVLEQQLAQATNMAVTQTVVNLMEQELAQIAYTSGNETFLFDIIDPPSVADLNKPVAPNVPIMVVIGLLLGLGLGSFLAMLLAWLRRW